jgi:hypothetical protein
MMKDGPHGARVDESKVEWENPTEEFVKFEMRRSM